MGGSTIKLYFDTTRGQSVFDPTKITARSIDKSNLIKILKVYN